MDLIGILASGSTESEYLQFVPYSAIRQGFPSIEWLQITKSVQWKFAIIQVLPF